MESEKILLRIKPERMAFLKFVLEGFGHLALMKTLSVERGEVVVFVPPQQKERWEKIWKDLEKLL